MGRCRLSLIANGRVRNFAAVSERREFTTPTIDYSDSLILLHASITSEVLMRVFPRFWSTQSFVSGVAGAPLLTVLPLAMLALQLFCTGCSRQNLVESVSVGDSGVEIRSSEWPLASTDWSAWRGRGQDGIAIKSDVPTTWSDANHVLWRSAIPGRGHSSPIVVGDSVFVATADDGQQIQSVL